MDNFIKILKEDDFNISTWSGGKTTELFIYPEDAEYSKKNFKVRISSATVELDTSNFTKLDGVYRFISPLDGNLKLTHEVGEFISLEPFQVYEFEGNIDTTSFGKVKDFNLMLANGANGQLKSFFIDEKKEVIILANYGLNIIYSFDSLFRISIDEEEIMLNPNEILVLKSDSVKNIKIQSNNSSNILLSSIVV